MPSGIAIVNKHHKVPYDLYIGRGSKWGNPFSHKEDTKAMFLVASKEEALDLYKRYIMDTEQLFNNLNELDNKILCCYCHPAKCHGDILKELRDEQLINTK